MSESLVSALTLDELRELLQQAGYRVVSAMDPVADVPYLRSATSGLSFDIRAGNPSAMEAEARFLDFVFVAVLQVQGELRAEVVNGWNATRRFSRLHLTGAFLALSMDISIAGGVSRDYLRAQIEIWDRLAQELIAYLREGLRREGEAVGSAPLPDRDLPASAASPN
ncbi:YbjN domain-containing protein [Methylosinus sp. Ce-a6]|uniref:YbjN domain-containing protein n=1 Tax=Methylosinus sp. Ce-a6 TaxID=2172005 RepID=UPI00135A5B0C|nr:YbjN domain-containing protein [Methylosinus sp. Ce-a6]